MARKAFITIAILLGGLGAFLAAGYGGDDRGLWWIGSHLNVIQGQLADLADHVRRYRKAHGRYPANDEGLSALDDFDARFAMHLYRDPMRPCDAPTFQPGQSGDRFFWLQVRDHIAKWRAEHGSAPTDIEQLSLATRFTFGQAPFEQDNDTGAECAEVAVGCGNNLFVITEAGVLSPWMLPYVYENRNGLDPSKFQGSPADADRERRYSVRVDDGVYVYSMGAQCFSERYDRTWWSYNGVRFVGVALLLGAVVTIAVAVRAPRKAAVALFVVSAGLGLAAAELGYATCYVMSAFFKRRDPEMIVRQLELLETFHARSILNDATYRKVRSSLPSVADEARE